MRASCSSVWRPLASSPISPPAVSAAHWTRSVIATSSPIKKFLSSNAPSLTTKQVLRSPFRQQCRSFTSTTLTQARVDDQNYPSKHNLKREQGVQLANHRKLLSRRELYQIFQNTTIDGGQGLRLLQILQGRRLNGTLDYPLPHDLVPLDNQDARIIPNALKFLRRTYPVDEDAAILRRLEAEEAAQSREQISNQDQFKPQSGAFGEKRGENNSIWGSSVLEQIRKRNEEQAALARERDDRMIDQLDKNLKQQGKPGGLVRAADQDLSVGRPITITDVKNNTYLRWKLKHSMEAQSDLSPEEATRLSTAQRLLPSAAFTALFLLGMYWFSQSWYEPGRMDRIWPNIPTEAATIFGIILANCAVFALWKMWPPAWKYLNRYFVAVPAYPYALSMLGNTFSHQSLLHLAMNMAALWFFGNRLHDELGRGAFLALYLSGGVFASFASLTIHTMRASLFTSSLGASGSLTTIMGAYFTLHSQDLMTWAFIPEPYQQSFVFRGATMLAFLVAADVVGVSLMLRTDNWAHLGGYLAGIVSGLWMKKDGSGKRVWDKVIIRR